MVPQTPPADDPYSQPVVAQRYTDGKTRDTNGCITGTPEYDKEWGTGRMNTLRNNQGRFIKICPKAAPETSTTPVETEEDSGPSQEQLIAQQAAHEYTSMSLPTPVLKANDGKEAHPGYMNLYYGYNTHFYTEKSSASTQRKEATLLGNTVIIEAIPVGYTYIYGDKLPIKAFALMVAFLSFEGKSREPAPAQTMTNPALSDT